MIRQLRAFPALLALLFLGLAAPADAHALLQHATPGVGATVQVAPTTLQLRFSEGVEAGFCTVAVTDAAGARVDTGKPQTAPDDKKLLSVALKPLPPGSYNVEWHAVSVDTHRTEGKFSFTVAP